MESGDSQPYPPENGDSPPHLQEPLFDSADFEPTDHQVGLCPLLEPQIPVILHEEPYVGHFCNDYFLEPYFSIKCIKEYTDHMDRLKKRDDNSLVQQPTLNGENPPLLDESPGKSVGEGTKYNLEEEPINSVQEGLAEGFENWFEDEGWDNKEATEAEEENEIPIECIIENGETGEKDLEVVQVATNAAPGYVLEEFGELKNGSEQEKNGETDEKDLEVVQVATNAVPGYILEEFEGSKNGSEQDYNPLVQQLTLNSENPPLLDTVGKEELPVTSVQEGIEYHLEGFENWFKDEGLEVTEAEQENEIPIECIIENGETGEKALEVVQVAANAVLGYVLEELEELKTGSVQGYDLHIEGTEDKSIREEVAENLEFLLTKVIKFLKNIEGTIQETEDKNFREALKEHLKSLLAMMPKILKKKMHWEDKVSLSDKFNDLGRSRLRMQTGPVGLEEIDTLLTRVRQFSVCLFGPNQETGVLTPGSSN